MIDQLDKQTQSLPLKQLPGPKKSGEAKSRAEIQKAYRERKNQSLSEQIAEKELEIEALKEQLRQALEQDKERNTDHYLEAFAGMWKIEVRQKGRSVWGPLVEVNGWDQEEHFPFTLGQAAAYIERAAAEMPGVVIRAKSQNGLCYEPK